MLPVYEVITILSLELTWILKSPKDLVTTELLGKPHSHPDYQIHFEKQII